MNIGIYPGNFDPVTVGHMDIILRSVKLVDRLIVAVYENKNNFYTKRPMFSVEERCELLSASLRGTDRVEVMAYSCLLTSFAESCGAGVIVRGLRNADDFEHEKQMSEANHFLSGIETVLIVSRAEKAHISSSLVKEIYTHGGKINGLVTPEVLEYLARDKEAAMPPS